MDFAAGGFLPAFCLPAGRPFCKDVDPEFGVGVDFAGFLVGKFERGEDGVGLHADVSGLACFGAEGDGLFVFDDSETAFAGVWDCGAVGVEDSHAFYFTRSEILTRICFVVSRSRTVTVSSSSVVKSTTIQLGVPISSWRR